MLRLSLAALPRPSAALALQRSVSSSPTLSAAGGPPPSRPGPPKLPRAEQREFDRLVAAASTSGAFSTPPSTTTSSPSSTAAPSDLRAAVSGSPAEDKAHPDARKTVKPDFEGDRNPVTGERGGPKKDPLLHREWTYGGRATDF